MLVAGNANRSILARKFCSCNRAGRVGCAPSRVLSGRRLCVGNHRYSNRRHATARANVATLRILVISGSARSTSDEPARSDARRKVLPIVPIAHRRAPHCAECTGYRRKTGQGCQIRGRREGGKENRALTPAMRSRWERDIGSIFIPLPPSVSSAVSTRSDGLRRSLNEPNPAGARGPSSGRATRFLGPAGRRTQARTDRSKS